MPKRHALLHTLLKAMDKKEPAFIETPFTVDYVRTPCFVECLASIAMACDIIDTEPVSQCFGCLVSFNGLALAPLLAA